MASSTISQPLLPLQGSCLCQHVKYRLETKPLFVHCCHCRCEETKKNPIHRLQQARLTFAPGCQRDTGSAFALNALIEPDRVTHVTAEPELIQTPSESGRGTTIARCPKCHVAIWIVYGSFILRFVRVGTLDQPELVQPDIHIFTSSKQPWVILPSDVPQSEESYDELNYWPPESLERIKVCLSQQEAKKPRPDSQSQ